MNATDLIASYDQNGVLGQLTGADPASLERFFREAHQETQAALEEARVKAAELKREIGFDCSRLSGVNGGDSIIVEADGRARRELEMFPEVEAQLLKTDRSADQAPCPSLEVARPLLARCAYNGLWSPSGTNWQPIRSVELTAEEASSFTGETPSACGLLVLARRRYQSILGDIANLCGFEQASHAESIDLGIWLLAAQETARGHGWRLQIRFLEEPVGQTIGILKDRPGQAARELLASVEADDHYPACLLLPGQGPKLPVDDKLPGRLRPSAFDRLIEARTTQRVASPARELPAGLMAELLAGALAFVEEKHRSLLQFPVYSWHDQMPASIGQAMHEGIEGPGGLMQRASLQRLRESLCECRELPDELQAWTAADDEKLAELGKQVALPASLVPKHIREKLTEGGHFSVVDDQLRDHRDRPISPVRLMKLVKMMSRSFGKFFLSFQNTHPLLGLMLADTSRTEPARLYQSVGRAVEHMTLLSRARGLTSIIKSGPLEIAGPAIKKMIAPGVPDEMEPVVTFQVGEPLGPDDPVGAGRPDQHSGLQERRLDRRAPRASLNNHYVPAN